MPNSEGALLAFVGLTKSFSGVPVLKGITLVVPRGAVLGLVGENGAGKSTLMNVIGGVHQPDGGSMQFDGRGYAPSDPLEASRAGVAFVHQELNLFANLSIADNIFITGFPERSIAGIPWIDRPAARRRTADLLARVELSATPDTLAGSLSQGERQLVEIAKALESNAQLIIFDEPTTSLSPRESARLFAAIQKLRDGGISIIYISHALDDVRKLCDRIAVLRDGEIVGSGPMSEYPMERIITLMVGRPLDQLYPERSVAVGPPVLEVRGISQPGVVHLAGMTLHRGEVLGLAGLMGSGRSEFARILLGLDPHATGDITLAGERLTGGPRERIRRGMALLTESRRDDGLFMDASAAENMEIVHRVPARIPGLAESLRIVCANLQRQPVKQLSGGNQQKVALGKWLVEAPRVLILDEPTRGIDVGAKFEIYRIIHDLAAKGVALFVISSEIEELMGICDRILVMRKGEIRAAFERPFDRERILGAAV